MLSGGLEVMADLLGASTADQHGATPMVAIAISAGAVLLFLVALWWLGGQTTRRRERSFLYLLPSALMAFGSVATVALGIPLAWSFLLLAASPFALIVVVTRQRQRRPEMFAIR